MKDATGELSTTVIAVVAIAAIAAIFTVVLLPQIKSSIILSQACSNGPGYLFAADDKSYKVSCPATNGPGTTNTTTWTCYYKDDAQKTQTVAAGETAKALSGNGVRSKVCNN